MRPEKSSYSDRTENRLQSWRPRTETFTGNEAGMLEMSKPLRARRGVGSRFTHFQSKDGLGDPARVEMTIGLEIGEPPDHQTKTQRATGTTRRQRREEKHATRLRVVTARQASLSPSRSWATL